MAKRSLRKSRHNNSGTNLSFKQRVQLGSTYAALVRGEINYNDVPQWMREVNTPLKQIKELTGAVDLTPIVETPHEHGEHCNHE